MLPRYFAGLIAAVLLAGGLPAAAHTPANTLVVAQALDEMVSIDPAQAYEVPSDELITNVYDQLFSFNSNSSDPQPDVITSWKRSDDGLTYSFEIRQGMKFHSGNPLTVDDVIFSLQRALTLNFAPANDLGSIGLLASNIAVSLQKTGPYSFSLKANRPYAPSLYLSALGLIVGSVVDQKLVLEHEANGDLGNGWLKTHSAGSGPFRLRNWTPLDSYVLQRVPGHWRGDFTDADDPGARRSGTVHPAVAAGARRRRYRPRPRAGRRCRPNQQSRAANRQAVERSADLPSLQPKESRPRKAAGAAGAEVPDRLPRHGEHAAARPALRT